MSSYDIFIFLLKVFVVTSMFFVLRGYGVKGLIKYSLLLLLISLLFIYFLSLDKKDEEKIPEEKPTLETQSLSVDAQNKINELKEHIKNGEELYICYLGREYDQLNLQKEAFEAFTLGVEKGLSECKTDLGMFYFNGRYVQKNWTKAGELWNEAYNDDKYGSTTNFNMAVYAINAYNNKQKYKYHLLKTTLLDENDDEAKMYLNDKLLHDINATELFLKEAVGDFYYTPNILGNKFSYGFNLYYRLTTMFDKKGLWSEDYDFQEENSIKFDTENSTLILGLKTLSLTSKLDSNHNGQTIQRIINEMELLNNTLFVDRNHLNQIDAFIEHTKAQLSLNKSFGITQKLSFFETYAFIYSVSYDKKNHTFSFEITIDDTNTQEGILDTLYIVLELKSLTAQTNLLTVSQETASFSQKRVHEVKTLIDEKLKDEKESESIKEKFDVVLKQIEANAQKFEKIKTLVAQNQLKEATTLAGFSNFEELFAKTVSEDSHFLTLFLDKTFSIQSQKNAKIAINTLENYTNQACISPTDLKQSQAILDFLKNNLKTHNAKETLGLLQEKVNQLQNMASQTLDVTAMKYWEVKDMYIQAIQNNCKKELLQLIGNEKHKDLINVKLIVEEPLIGLKESVKNSYTPLSFAKRHHNSELATLLEEQGAKEELE
ncbi:MAG: hypothetical protein WCR15_01785 [Arcobacteraceae bacterium]